MKNNKNLTEKYGRNIKMQHFEEGIRSGRRNKEYSNKG